MEALAALHGLVIRKPFPAVEFISLVPRIRSDQATTGVLQVFGGSVALVDT